MTERLLQFIWQFQYFNKTDLLTTDEQSLQIIFAGELNTNQGPDFSNAKIKIAATVWAGTIELHIKTSDWDKHKHTGDKNYDNVVLHVVWENDGAKSTVPVLELKQRVSKILLHRYENLMNSKGFIPCEKNLQVVKHITWQSWKERLLAERLLRKASIVQMYLQQNNYHWEETFWWLLCRNFGIKVNAEAFEAIARSVPLNILAKQKYQLHQLEALLFGQAGLLQQKFMEDYPQMLQKEYKFQQAKYSLVPVKMPIHFLRMRPVNFPTVRIAQLAMLVKESHHLFSKIKEAADLNEVRKWFAVTANDYWHYHYRFDELSAFKKKTAGADFIDNIIINTVCPLVFAYGVHHNQQSYKDKAIQWLQQTMAEVNSITKGFQQLGIENKTAFDSQSLIELKNEYCNYTKCLNCGIGNAILKS